MVAPLIWILGAGAVALLEGCTGGNDNTGDGGALKVLDDTWQPKPDAGGMDDDAHGATDRDYYAPDGGVSPDAGPADDIQEPDTEGPQGLVDNDGDGVLGCVSESNYTGSQPYSDFKKICDCNDNNKYIKPATAAEYVAQGLVSFDTNCNGTTAVNVNKDAVKFVGNYQYGAFGGQNMALGDINHDGFADVILASPNDSDVNTWPDVDNGKVYIFFGGVDKFKPGTTLTMDQADVLITGGANWGLGGSLAAVPNYGDTNNDGRVDESDFCDLMILAGGYNLFESGDENANLGEGDGNPANGKAAAIFVKGRANWPAHYSFYNIPNVNGEVVVDGHNAASLTQNQMGIIKSQADGFNISWGPAFGKHVNEGKRDVMLGETNTGRIHLLPAAAYLGLNWLDDVQTTLVRDQTFAATTAQARNHHLADVSGDGVVDMVLANTYNNNAGYDSNGRVTVVQGQLNNIPEQVVLAPMNVPPKDESNNPLPYYTLSGAATFDGVGLGVVLADLQGTGHIDLAVGAPGQSGGFEHSGCVPTLFTSIFQPLFDGADYVLNSDLPGYGLVLDGDAVDSYITYAENSLSGALSAFRPSGLGYSHMLIGAPEHPDGARFHVGDVSYPNMMSQFQISTGILPTVEGPLSFGSWFSNGADVNGSGAESVLVGAPKAENNKGAAYLFVGVPQ